MKDVAAKAGVSITTVSHILNNTREVAPATRERVLEAMRTLNYYRSAFGRRLARGRSDSYGLIISDIENPFFPELIRSFEAWVLDRGCDVLLCTTGYDPERARHAVRRMIENKVLGVAVMTAQLDPALVDEMVAADVPVVRLDAGKPSRGRSNIRVDYSGGAAEVAAHLKGLGHERLGFLTGASTRVSAVVYRDTLLGALTAAGIPEPVLVEGADTIDGGAECARTLLDRTNAQPPTAILCGNDLAALGAMRVLMERGIRVPDDISVIGADDVTYARFSTPALTTLRVPRDRLGAMAGEALERTLRSKRRQGYEYVLETHLVVRNSTARAKA